MMLRSSLFLLSITFTFFSILSMNTADNNLRGMSNNSTLAREENPLLKDESDPIDIDSLAELLAVVRIENDAQTTMIGCPQKCKNYNCPKKKRPKCIRKIINGVVRRMCRCIKKKRWKPKPEVCSPLCGTGYECHCILPGNPDLCQCRPLNNNI
mmetsp:Transcript_38842/g.75751  ORF Transcript_38842/g.75751 Transcript_38842/m.75751 type:complete len:154 (-) Transcript_38842:20-481(-)